ncbi:hypothetical protein [Laceyella tengchongensis]|uniref:Uncharacterized protein n=1 Tax=Laceyella tengchongensis TaxID=574699 RepID=A0AA45WJP7_9BACL|nr:hypothetical protein [Laceyella tengchongensis]MRG28066.1 hypothetical protein [Laceyella tengchongensis]SMP03856.1 hypothetical protein SAMN06265361_101494 [Laceyella tengchongensis]
MRTVDAFLKGYKPAFLEIPHTKFTTEKLDLLLVKYPYVDEKAYDLLNGNAFYLFFQNQSVYARFQTEIEHIAFTKGEIDRLLGDILGFPPKAIDFYVRMMTEKRNGNIDAFQRMKNRKIGMIYCGCSFGSDVNDFVENALWLLEKYPYEEAKKDGMFVRIGLESRLSVPIGSYRELTEFHEYIMQQSSVVPV